MFKLIILLLVSPIFVTSNPVLYIAGGSRAYKGTVPYQVSLRLEGIGHCCGGSIITSRAILTAAHCVEGVNDPDQWEAVVGTNKLDAGGQFYSIRKIVSHEKYYKSSRIIIHDIAVMFTDEDIQFSDKVQPIELNDEPPMAGDELLVSGWGGISEDGPYPNDLFELFVNVVSREDCEDDYKSPIYKTQVCALAEPGRGTCYADSGGPLADITDNKLVGIVSGGINPCGRGSPDLYTNVYSYVPWIEKALREDSKMNDFLNMLAIIFGH